MLNILKDRFKNIFRNNNYIDDDYDITRHDNNFSIGSNTTTEEDIRNLEQARDTSRLYAKNNGFIKGLLRASRDNVIGTGLKAKSNLSRKHFKNLTESQLKNIEDNINNYFNKWALSKNSDITQNNNFYLQQRLAYFTYKRDGDVFATLPLLRNEINLRLIPPEFVTYDSVDGFIQGIRTNQYGRPVEYAINKSEDGLDDFIILRNSINKQNVLHLFDNERINSLRGMPFTTEIIRDCVYIDDYMKSELLASQIASKFIGTIKTKSNGNIFETKKTNLLKNNLGNTEVNLKKQDRIFKHNTITQLKPDEELDIINKGRDNPNFDKIVNTSLQKVSSCTRIPIEIILTVFTSSYSASRASMLLLEKFIKPEREIFNAKFNNPIRNQVIEWGVLKGDLNIPDFFNNKDEYLNCEWLGDTQGSVDPVKDAKAKIALIDNNLTTREKATRDLGNGDFEANAKQLEKEREILKQNNLISDEVTK
tara:strand:+ start:390 stop:1826 length:1437 start_codon:yes stop_codon:yes gene_type:complete